ncbi:MAG TPA: selenium-dependent molybdenum cofactor biosynthesis protein YqeB [Desulfobacterales bacterium]|jgi:xanthine dehydrogenase accessory factor|nr:selenium-dependent molybdenum cofactor biosynthesis protein YqeB [Desulfobacterales bacterium]HJO61974.1 selenium-dependent molybdenum cofactor biosynthesis protein YqeB [Desulfobacterales bacterium]
MSSVHQLIIGIKGAGEMASAIACRLYMANIRKIFMMEVRHPIAVRRGVSFCDAIYEGRKAVEGVEAISELNFVGRENDSMNDDKMTRDRNRNRIFQCAWGNGKIVVVVDPDWRVIEWVQPHVVVDAILAKKNLGTRMKEAPLVIGLGPGFVAENDVNMVIETNRGHHLGRIITHGSAEPNTGIPGNIGGFTAQRVMRAPVSGIFRTTRKIGDMVEHGDIIGEVDDGKMRAEVVGRVEGVIRGLIRKDTHVNKGLKIGDIDPRGDKTYCYTISDKARAIAGSLLEAVLRRFNGVNL